MVLRASTVAPELRDPVGLDRSHLRGRSRGSAIVRTMLSLIALLLPAAASAQAGCPGQTQIQAEFCAKAAWEVADAELNRLWGVVKPIADARGQGASLLDAQRAWLRRRDAACEPELSSGGSAAAMFYWACMEEQTLRRNDVLRRLR